MEEYWFLAPMSRLAISSASLNFFFRNPPQQYARCTGQATKGAFVWDQSGIRIIGIMQVSVCLGAILIPEYLDSILAILLPGAE